MMNLNGSFNGPAWCGVRAALAVVVATTLAGCASVGSSAKFAESKDEDESEVAVLLQDLPGPVQAALLAEAYKAGGVIGEIERETESDGSVVYEGTVKLPGGGEVEVEVAPDGRVLEVETP
jgi:hypothetical protein